MPHNAGPNKKAGPVAGSKSGPSPRAGTNAAAPTTPPSVQKENKQSGATKGHVSNGVKPTGIGGSNRGCK